MDRVDWDLHYKKRLDQYISNGRLEALASHYKRNGKIWFLIEVPDGGKYLLDGLRKIGFSVEQATWGYRINLEKWRKNEN